MASLRRGEKVRGGVGKDGDAWISLDFDYANKDQHYTLDTKGLSLLDYN